MRRARHLAYKNMRKGPPMLESPLERRRRGRSNTTGALAERSALLAEIEWRILHWLLHYPLQCADDLVVGVACWASRATVYRHVRALEEQGLVESVVPKTPRTGKRGQRTLEPGRASKILPLFSLPCPLVHTKFPSRVIHTLQKHQRK